MGRTHYGPSAGLPQAGGPHREVARTAASRSTRSRWWLPPGLKPVLFFTILATVDEGDEVLLPDPGFPIYESVVRYIRAVPVPVPLSQDRDFRFDPDDLRRRVTGVPCLVILNSPHNPTGGVLAPEDLAAVAEVAVARDLWVLSDGIYSRLLYRGEHHSVAPPCRGWPSAP